MRNRVFAVARDAVSSDEGSILPLNPWVSARALVSCLALIALPLSIASIWSDLKHGWPLIESIVVEMIILVILLLLAYISGLLVGLLLSLRITAKGIPISLFSRKEVTISWADIKTVQSRRLLFLPWLEVTTFRKEHGRTLIPIFVRSPESLRAAVAHHASPNNPLRRYLEDEHEPEREPLGA